MCGYGPYEKRVCTEVLDPLYARALWLEGPQGRLLLITADLCTIDASTRQQAAAFAGSVEERAKIENALTQSLRSLIALAEAYPQLRAVESFTQLQTTLTQIEEAIQNARRYYNAVVRDLNTKIAQFPSNVVANLCAFKPREFFELTIAAEREVPQVRFGPGTGGAGTSGAGTG
jgi:hypothetical protein